MARPIVHGLRRRNHTVPEYRVYAGIKNRCLNPDHRNYAYYGARGVTVCAGWLTSFVAFYADMKGRPSLKHTIDRIDVAGGYWCGHCDECVTLGRVLNCRWATKAEQAQNRTNNNRLTFNGVTRCEAAWADTLEMSRATLRSRLSRGWSVEEALTRGVNEGGNRI